MASMKNKILSATFLLNNYILYKYFIFDIMNYKF